MPMQRKRPRERETRFHYRFLERFDLIETSEVTLLSVCFILILGMQARRGINAVKMLLAGIITALASALSKEAHTKRCTSRLSPESKPLRIEDLRDDEYFYRRFRFRKDPFLKAVTPKLDMLQSKVVAILDMRVSFCVTLLPAFGFPEASSFSCCEISPSAVVLASASSEKSLKRGRR
jgi:hypothetical protein